MTSLPLVCFSKFLFFIFYFVHLLHILILNRRFRCGCGRAGQEARRRACRLPVYSRDLLPQGPREAGRCPGHHPPRGGRVVGPLQASIYPMPRQIRAKPPLDLSKQATCTKIKHKQSNTNKTNTIHKSNCSTNRPGCHTFSYTTQYISSQLNATSLVEAVAGCSVQLGDSATRRLGPTRFK